jgi:hypothetical protein
VNSTIETSIPVNIINHGCVVTLATTTTRDRVGEDVEVLSEARGVTLADSPRGLAGVLPGELEQAERHMIADELAAFVTCVPRGAFVLERLLLQGNGRAVHMEARIVPVKEAEQRDLAELLHDQSDPDGGRELAALYAHDIEATWVTRAGGAPLPACFLEDLDHAAGSLLAPSYALA